MMSVAAVSRGTSIFIETIFSDRFKHIEGLTRFGANIKSEQSVAVVEGVDKLYGACVTAPDLRGGAAYVVSALAAVGKSEIHATEHIERGYENICENLSELGADITERKE